MLIEYIEAAMRKAHYKIIDDDEPYYGEIPGFKGLWANGKSLESCRENLQEALESWILISVRKGISIPKIGRIILRPIQTAKA
jgi:predicted RNase H-like HicB family nuclease